MKTEICELLNIEYPILQGGMAWVSTAELAAAVSEAGGLGIIGAGHAPGDWVRKEIVKIKERTNKPFGVNVMLMSPFVDQVIQVILEEKVPMITTGAGSPGKYIPALKEIGTKVIPLVPSVALAKRMEKAGADAIVAEGMESGGHIGELTTMAMVPQIVDAVDIPVIAAGGIFDGRGLVAALALGAKGIQVGTRFMCAEECTIHERVKEFLLKAKDRDTVTTGKCTGHPVRCLKNRLTKELEDMERRGVSPEELESYAAGSLQRAMIDGDVDTGSVMAGQVAGMINEIQPAKVIIDDIIDGARKVLKNLEGLQ